MVYFFGVMVTTLLVAFVLHLVAEKPLSDIQKVYLR